MPRISDYSLTRIIAHLDHFRKRAATEDCGGIRWMPIEDVKLEDDVPRVPTKPGDIWSFGMTIFVSTNLFESVFKNETKYYMCKLLGAMVQACAIP